MKTYFLFLTFLIATSTALAENPIDLSHQEGRPPLQIGDNPKPDTTLLKGPVEEKSIKELRKPKKAKKKKATETSPGGLQ